MPDRHAPNSWEQYQEIHAKKIAGYSPHFIVNDDLVPQLTPDAVIWRGVLYCVNAIEIHVFKVQAFFTRPDGRPAVQTQLYEYHVMLRLPQGERNLFRYDNAHAHVGHADPHHRHGYDDDGTAQVEHLSERGWAVGDWPTLGDVIDEVHEWWRSASTAPPPTERQ